MALIGFPNQIEVVIGDGWTGTAPFNEDDTIVLTKVSGQDIWTEDGTDTPGAANRLRLEPLISVTATYSILDIRVSVITTGETSWILAGRNSWDAYVPAFGGNYIFQQMWDLNGDFGLTGAGYLYPDQNHQVGVFKTYQEYSNGETTTTTTSTTTTTTTTVLLLTTPGSQGGGANQGVKNQGFGGFGFGGLGW